MFPRGIDGLFLPAHEGVDVLALIQRGSPEETWAGRFLAPSQRLLYDLPGDLGPYPATEEILLRSDVHRAMKARRVPALLLSAACTPATQAWAERHGIQLLMSDYRDQRRLEDKIWFDAFLRRHRIPTPAGGPVVLGGTGGFPARGRAVIQARASMGGEGTYFVSGAAEAARLADQGVLRRGERYLVRRFVEGDPYGITILVGPGVVALSAVRRQCYYPADGARPSRVFAGIQWVPSPGISGRLRARIDRIFLRLGDLLYRRRFFGFANVDFMVDAEERVLVIECNPRMSAATPQLLHVPGLLSGTSAGAVFLDGFLGCRTYTRSPARTPVPDTSYEGATLDLVASRVGSVRQTFESGLHAFGTGGIAYLSPDVRRLAGGDELALISFARAGQECRAEDTLGSVVAGFPLYDARGEMTARARQLESLLRYTE
jgi:hypothetical protein